jgi:hypothetical protein
MYLTEEEWRKVCGWLTGYRVSSSKTAKEYKHPKLKAFYNDISSEVGRWLNPKIREFDMAKRTNGRQLVKQDNDSLRKQFEDCRDLLLKEREEVIRLRDENHELVSLNLWSARRLPSIHKQFAYDELELISGTEHERV